jgi:hypothetical protein
LENDLTRAEPDLTSWEGKMLITYFNYPNSRISAHDDFNCSRIQPMHKAGQRTIHINTDNLRSVLRSLEDKEFKFGSEAKFNDLWVFIDLNDNAEEEKLLRTIQNIIGMFYKRLAKAEIGIHC